GQLAGLVVQLHGEGAHLMPSLPRRGLALPLTVNLSAGRPGGRLPGAAPGQRSLGPADTQRLPGDPQGPARGCAVVMPFPGADEVLLAHQDRAVTGVEDIDRAARSRPGRPGPARSGAPTGRRRPGR